MNAKVAEKLLRQKQRADDDDDSDDDFVATPAKSTSKAKTRVKSRRQSSFAPSPAITPIAEEGNGGGEEEYMVVPAAGAKDTGLTGKYWAAAADDGSTPVKGMGYGVLALLQENEIFHH